MRYFHNSKAEVWKQLSEKLGARFVAGNLLHDDRIEAHVDGWTLTLDTYREPVGRATVTHTRIRAPFVNPHGFRFCIYTHTVFSGLGKFLGMQDVEIGDPAFDAQYIIKGTEEACVRALFADTRLRELIAGQPSLYLEVKDDEGWFGARFPQGVDELYFQTHGVLTDLNQLASLYELFAEALHQLCRIGSASPDDPHVPELGC